MIPLLFSLGPIPVNSFGLMVAAALVAAGARLARSFRAHGLDPGSAERYVMLAGVSGLVGARLWFVGSHFDELRHDLVGALTSGAGFTFYGGFLVAAAVVYVAARREGVAGPRFVDSIGPALALGYAVGRLGCQLSGDGDYGSTTDGFWGMSYDTGIVPTPPGSRAYPTPLFESAASLLVLWVLTVVERRGALAGNYQRFGLYLVLMSTERFLVEFLRIEDRYAGGLSQAQYVAVGLAAVGAALLAAGARTTPAAPPPGTGTPESEREPGRGYLTGRSGRPAG